jgi:hypothetical protein
MQRSTLQPIVAGGALLAVFVLFSAPDTRAFSTIGHSLGLDQRDVRVFNNFLDPEANDNTTPHPTWPGAIGAPMAIWKAVAEWGSRLHGDGQGDPSQVGDVGSGGANFDVTWQGAAPDAGSTTGNVVSATSNCAGGITSETVLGSNGWTIRLCDNFLWDDGPGTVLAPNALDIQGVVAHEYGHVLGLGHSAVGGATMAPSITGNGVSFRSIAADDIAGVRFIYGTAAPTKPRIDSALPGSMLILSGANFAPTNNEVWFTRAGVNPDGTPLVVTGLVSSGGGTKITLAVPAGAGPGDVLVRIPGLFAAALSNAFPLDPAGCPPPAVYCTAKTSSKGCVAQVATAGTPSASAGSGFDILASDVPNQVFGVLFYGTNGSAEIPFQGGTLCVGSPVTRTAAQSSGGSLPPASDCSGTFSFDFNAYIAGGQDPALVAGAGVWCQHWFRDPGFPPPNSSALSAAIAFLVCP